MAVMVFLTAGMLMFFLAVHYVSTVSTLVFWTTFGTVHSTTLLAAWFAASFFFIALGLYALRARFRLLYGLLEVLVGIIITLGAIEAYSVAVSHDFELVKGGVILRSPEGWLQWHGDAAGRRSGFWLRYMFSSVASTI